MDVTNGNEIEDSRMHRADVGQALYRYVVADTQAPDPGHSAIKPADSRTLSKLHNSWKSWDESEVHRSLFWMRLLCLLRFVSNISEEDDDTTHWLLTQSRQELSFRPILDHLRKPGSVLSLLLDLTRNIDSVGVYHYRTLHPGMSTPDR